MNAIAVNGSPRKNRNTATLLENALKGAASGGSEIEMIDLYALNFSGCVSCYSCKRTGGKNYSKCASVDGLTTVLEKIANSNVLIMGSPIYMGGITGEMKSFIERLLFPYFTFSNNASSYKGNVNVGFIYNMGMPFERFEVSALKTSLASIDVMIKRTFGNLESLYIFNTSELDDYRGIDYPIDIEKKRKWRKEVFPEDCKKACELGVKLAKTQ